MNNQNIKTLLNDLKNGTSHSLRYLLSDSIDDTLSEHGIKIRKFFAPLLRTIYRTQSEYKYKLVSKAPLEKNKVGNIFIVNHRQPDDMVFSALTAGVSGYFVFGNPVLASENISNGFGLWAYGLIILNRNVPSSRKACYEKMKYVLEHGENIIIFPEGYWNLADDGLCDGRHESDCHNSECWLIQDFNIGSFRLAQEIGAKIVPLVLHYDELKTMTCYAKRCEAESILPNDDVFLRKNEILEKMQSEKFYLMEKYSSYKRGELLENGIDIKKEWAELQKELIAKCDIDNVNVSYRLDLQDEKLIGKAKVASPKVTENDAFEVLDKVPLTNKNALVLVKTRNKR